MKELTSSLGFIAWFVVVMFLVSVFAGDKMATGLIAVVLISVLILNSDRVTALINSSFPKG